MFDIDAHASRILVNGVPHWRWPDGTTLPVIAGGDGGTGGDKGDPDKGDPDPPDPKGDADPPDPDKGDPDPKDEAEKWKALARKHEKQAKSNADAAKRLAEIEESQKSETEKAADSAKKADERASYAEREATRLRVALRKGLTETQAKRLIGDTEEELEEDADELLASFKAGDGDGDKPKPRRPKEKLRSGATSDEEPDETDPMALASKVPRL